MSVVWWGKETFDGKPLSAAGPFGPAPRLSSTVSPAEVVDRVAHRRSAFTPEWVGSAQGDAGDVFSRLVGEQIALVVERLNRLPEKAAVDFVNLSGLRTRDAKAATAIVEFTVSPAARGSVFIPRGFQVGARSADDEGGSLVVFETQRDLFATSAEIAELYAEERTLPRDVGGENREAGRTFLPFGSPARIDNALLIGIEGDAPPRRLSLRIRVHRVPGEPPWITMTRSGASRDGDEPVLVWEIFAGEEFESLKVLDDGTDRFRRSGQLDLELPEEWPEARPAGLAGSRRLRWLRVRLASGRFKTTPELVSVALNRVDVLAEQTVRDEILEPIEGPARTPVPSAVSLRHRPIVPGSLAIEVTDSDGTTQRWREVDDLAEAGPEERVFELDAAEGVVRFGDGLRGAAVPPGFRNVRAVIYRVGGGAESRVQSGEIDTLLSAAPFVTDVANPERSSGGLGVESTRAAVRRGVELLRARQRAVTPSDYALLALESRGADVRRAHAIAGYDPGASRFPKAGAVGVLVLPPHPPAGPPVPDDLTLRAVADHLTRNVAPAGVEVAVAGPRYREIRVEVGFVPAAEADVGRAVREISTVLETFLDPLFGGENRNGWPFGRELEPVVLVKVLLERVGGVRAVPRLRWTVDGVRFKAGESVSLAVDELFWPDSVEVYTLEEASS